VSLTLPGRYDAWDYPTAPRIRHISATGCGNPVMTSNVTLTGCQGGAVLQMYGTHFLSEPFVMAIAATTPDTYNIINRGWLALCEEFTVVSDTYATCVLPQVGDSSALQYDTPLMMFMYNTTSWMRSNALFFTFDSAGSTIVTAPSSSSHLALLVALPVVLGVLAVAAVVAVVVVCLQRKEMARRGSSSQATDVFGDEVKQQEVVASGWWHSTRWPSLASHDSSRGVELIES